MDAMVAIGVICLLVACSVAVALGGRPERLCAGLTLGCWLVVMLAQLVFGTRRMEPVIIGDVVYSVGLLGLCYFSPKVWLWMLAACEAAAFVMHAYLYNGEVKPSYAYAATLNGLSFVELAVLALAAVWRAVSLRRRRVAVPAVGQAAG